MAIVAENVRCAPGNECRLTVENATEIRSLKDDLSEVKADVKEIKKLIDKLVYGVAGSVILLLLNWVWQLARKG